MIRGSCLCGGIRFEVAKVPMIVLCHCSMCRKANGSAFDAGGTVPPEDFAFLEGEPLVRSYESSPGVQRAFCSVCGSRAPWKAPDGSHYWVPMGALDGDPGARPALHIFVGSKAPWWEIRDDLPQFEESVPGYGPGDAK
jgi:hypothetical protein